MENSYNSVNYSLYKNTIYGWLQFTHIDINEPYVRGDRSSGTNHLNDLEDHSDQDYRCFSVYLVSLTGVITEYKTEIMGAQNFYIVIPGFGIFVQRNNGDNL